MECPNINHQDWKDLVESIGLEQAKKVYALNGGDIPTLKKATKLLNVLDPINKIDKDSAKYIQASTLPIDYGTRLNQIKTTLSENRINDGVGKAVGKFLASIGVDLKATENITDINGNPIDAIAKAEMIQKTILFSQGKLDLKALGEEAAHFYVELLPKDSALLKSMYDNIDKFGIYKDVVAGYGDHYKEIYGAEADERLRKEAIAQLINKHIVNGEAFESGGKQAYAIKWWDKVINFVKSLFGKANVKEYTDDLSKDPYFKAAKDLLASRGQDLDLDKNITGEYYQLTPKQKGITDKLQELDSQIQLDEPTHTYTLLGKKVKDAVSDIVNRRNPFKGSVDPDYKDATQQAGTTIHSYIENAIKRATEVWTGNITTQKIANNPVYDKVEGFISDFVNRPEFKGAQFLTELKVADAKGDRGGTIDLAIVMPDGKVHIYDWKSVNFKTAGGEVIDSRVSPTKERNYNIQLGEYKSILESRGITNFGHIRIMPIQTIFKGELKNGTLERSLKDIKVGTDDKHLQPVISEAEKTGVPSLDNLLNALIVRRHALENALASIQGLDKVDRQHKRDFIVNKLTQIAHAMTEIHTDHKINQFLDYLSNEMDTLARNAVGSAEGTVDILSDHDFTETYKNIGYFQELIRKNLAPISDSITGESKERLHQLAMRFTEAESLLYSDLQRRIKDLGEDANIGDITKAEKQTGWWSRMFRYATQQTNTKMATLMSLVDKQKQVTIREHARVNDEIEEKVKALKSWGAKNGFHGLNVYKRLLNKEGTALAPKYSKEFRDKLNEAYDKPSVESSKFLKESLSFDKDRYERSLGQSIDLWTEKYGTDQKAIDNHIKWFEEAYNVDKNEAAYGKDNHFLSYKDNTANHSAEYKYIYQKGNEALKDFYEHFVNKTEEWRDVMGLDKDRNFIWNVKKDLVEKIIDNGIQSFVKLPSILNQLEQAHNERSQQVLTDESGAEAHRIPKYFVNPILKPEKQADGTIKMVPDGEAKSHDLGKVLSLAGAMAMNYKHMTEIEDASKVLQLSVSPENSQEIITDYRGRPVPDLIRGGVITAAGSADTLSHFNDIMNYYLYGVRNKTKDITFNIMGRKISALSTYSGISKYFTGKTLAGNTVSIISNILGGNVNARILGVSERYFTNEQYTKAMYKMLPSRDPKAYAIMGYFDIMEGSKIYEKANGLSANNLVKHLTYEKMFMYGHEKTDSWIRNSALLALMQNHTMDEAGAIVKKTKEQPSLYDMTEIKDGAFNIPNLSENEYYKFRNKAMVMGERILGNSTRENMRGANLTVLGRSLMMFRSWIPRMIDERFGELRKDYDLNDHEYGRYRAFAKTIFDTHIGDVAKNLSNTFLDFGVLGFKPWKGENANAAINARLQELYYKDMEKDPTMNISLDEYKSLLHDNLKTSMMEFQVIASLGLLTLGLKSAIGKHGTSQEKFLMANSSRLLSDMAFFSGLGFNDIMQNAIPIQSLVNQGTLLTKSVYKDIFEDHKSKAYKNSGHRARAMLPFLSALDRLESIFKNGQ